MRRNRVLGILLALILGAFAVQTPLHAGEKIDVNTASVEQLEKVKGIGPKTAEAIVNYRKEHGAFSSLDELAKVKGIGEKKLEMLKASLTVGEEEKEKKEKEEKKEHED